MEHLFIQDLFNPATRFRFCAWVFVVIASTVLHELAHGWVALAHGDDTPRTQGRMTGNPLVHMGTWSLLALAVAGIAWGQMPIDPGRLRGKYAEAKVALAGPGMNLLIAGVCIVALGLARRYHPLLGSSPHWQENLYILLRIGGAANLLLCLFNLMPAPPLDGSHALANVSRPYAMWADDPSHHGVMMMFFIVAFVLAGYVWQYAFAVTDHVTLWIAMLGH